MKNIKLTLVVFSIILSMVHTNAQAPESAVEYMTKIFAPLEKSKEATWQYLKAMTRGKGARKIDAKRHTLITELKSEKYEVKRVGSFKGDDQLLKAIVGHLDLTDVVLREDFDKILDMEDIAEQSYDLMEAYILAKEKASEKLETSYQGVVEAQKTFAAANNINLIEGKESTDKTAKKINEASKALEYYNDVYLVFFKVYKQEAYALDALSHKDLNAFEQTTNSLLKNSLDGMEKLSKLENYKGDPTLKLGAQKIITFYKKEAEKDFPQQTAFFMKKDNFEKQKKEFEAIPQNKRTQKDVDEFNKAVYDYNEAIKLANSSIESSNNERDRALKLWNDSVEQFFEKHSN